MWNVPSPQRAFAVIRRVTAATASIVVTIPAKAHGFGQRYDLPLPLSLYLWATAAAVVLSFVVAGLFVHQTPRGRPYWRLDLLAYPVGRIIASPLLGFVLRLAAVVLFVVVVVAGFIGNADPYRNIAPTLVWVVAWVGLAYVSAFVGDVWALLNPWRSLFGVAQWACARRRSGRDLSLGFAYPEGLGVWPAFALLL